MTESYSGLYNGQVIVSVEEQEEVSTLTQAERDANNVEMDRRFSDSLQDAPEWMQKFVNGK